MDDKDITIHGDVISLVGNLSLVVAGIILFSFGLKAGNIPLCFLGGLLTGLPIGFLRKWFNGRGW